MKNANTLAPFVKRILRSHFPQFKFLKSGDFIQYLRKRDIYLSKTELERFEKTGLLTPIARLTRQKIRNDPPRYATVYVDAYYLKCYYKKGLLKIPKSGDFRPWKDYKDGYEDTKFIFYHPFQILLIYRILYLQLSEETMVKYAPLWNKQVGLLLLLEEPYAPIVTNTFIEDP